MAKATMDGVKNIILDMVEDGRKEMTWAEIVAAVSAKCTVSNWMMVRSVLQIVINAGIIKRTSDVHAEVYAIVFE